MAEIAGIYCFDRRELTPENRAAALRAVGEMPNLVTQYGQSGLFMVAAEARDFGSSDSCACLCNGSLDHGGLPAFCKAEQNAQEVSQGSLLAAIIDAFGPAGFRYVVGDWSAVVWQPQARQLLLASDYAGVRPLYYWTDRASVVWCSSLSSLLDWVGTPELDEAYIAQFLITGATECATPYRNIRAVPPGAFVRISQNVQEVHAYWSLPVGRVVRYKSESDYEEHLRILFKDAVKSHLNTAAPVCAEVSGGLDSSSIACVASRLIADRSVESPNLVTVSYRERGSRDEPFIDAMQRHLGGKLIDIEFSADSLVESSGGGTAAPTYWVPRFRALRSRVLALGSKVLLTGQLGDLIMGNWHDGSSQTAEYLVQGRLSSAFMEALSWSRETRTPVYPLLWRALCAATPWDKALCRSGDAIEDDFLIRRLRGNWRQSPEPARWLVDVTPGKRRLFQMVHHVLSERRLQTPEALQGLSYAHPYAYRPLVEFMLAVPSTIVCRPGVTRRLMRRALAELVPSFVLNRRSKASYDAVYRQSCRPLAAEILRSPSPMLLAQYGYVIQSKVMARLKGFLDGLDAGTRQLRNIILLEFWLRGREHKRQAEVA